MSKKEARNYVTQLLTAIGESPKISDEEFNILFEELDKDDNGTISKDEINYFIRVAKGEEPMPEKKPPTPEEITENIWAQYDADKSGVLNKKEARNFVSALLTALGETPKISDEEFNTLFEDLDKDDNGTISRDEVTFFIRVAQGEEPMPVK